jgi:uncharacterized damage-inducible protein DinB
MNSNESAPAALIGQFAATHSGDPWYGSSRSKLLDGIDANQAAAHPIPGAHSIWELVLHMAAWTNEVRRRLEGTPPADPLEGDWPPVGPVTREGWIRALASLNRTHTDLRSAIEALAPDRWSEPVGPVRDPALGTGVSVAGMLVGIAQHDAYHTGQVALLRRALGLS